MASTVRGYAAVFNSRSVDLGGFVEKLSPGCFRSAIARCDVRALFNHDPSALLGRQSAGTLRLSEDTRGLMVEIDLPDTRTGQEVGEMVRRGDLKGQSFSFTTRHDSWDLSGPTPLRTVHEVDELMDVGPVTYPAYEQTSIGMRSAPRRSPSQQSIAEQNLRARLALLEAGL